MRRLIGIGLLVGCLLGCLPGAVLAQPCETPNLMIVLDRSGSMQGTKWTQAKGAIQYILNNYGNFLRFGLDMFPSNDMCGAGNVQVDVGNNTATTIMNTLNATSANGNTPMAATLMVLNQYRPLKDVDRRNFVMLVSDGDDTCAEDGSNDPVRAASDLYNNGIRTWVIGFGSGANPGVLNAIAAAGHTGSYHQADDQASLQVAMDSIVAAALVEVCDDRDNDCDSLIDEDWPEKGQLCEDMVGQCLGQGVWICNAAGDGLECDAHVNTGPELCDGLDNDCDGLIDEDFPDVDGDAYSNCTDCCDSGTESMLGCNTTNRAGINPGAAERCNGFDDNCNGAIDEDDPQLGDPCGTTDEGECEFGGLLCVNGSLDCVGEVEPQPELLCDDLDNNCDGLTDEGRGPEICDDLVDNDCDGLIDSWDDDCSGGCVPGQQQPCGNDEGDCVAGVQTCEQTGGWGPCEGGYPGSAEVCDGRDNDCDSVTDEDDVCGGGSDCTPGEQRPCGVDEGECRAGVQTCTSDGYWADCAGSIDPLPEWCDDLDNDCDGITDEGNLCEGYEVCLCGTCSPVCSAGECPSGDYHCVNSWCVVDPCCGVNCPVGQECDDSGRCVDPCVEDGVQCQPGEDCRMGICVPADCYTAGNECPAGQVCIEGQCQADACDGVTCPTDQYCRDGLCEGVACGSCSPDQSCVEGQCVDDPCAGLYCPPGQECLQGECAADPCNGVYCAPGTACLDGTCTGDPCEGIDCPDLSHCQDGYCVADEPTPEDGGVDAGHDAGQDGGADAGADQPASDPGPADAGQDGGTADEDSGGAKDGCSCRLASEGKTPVVGWVQLLLLLALVRRRL